MLARLMTMTLIAGLALPPVAKAEGLITSISPRQLAKILELEGEEMALSTINDDTTLHSSSAQRGDPKAPLPFEIFFYECDGGEFAAPAMPDSDCLSFEFRAYAPGPPNAGEDAEIANSWNESFHMGKVWRDTLGDVALQMSAVVDGGVTPENIRTIYRRWRMTLAAFDVYLKQE